MTGVPHPDIRVLLVDDQDLVRSGLRQILRRRDGFVIAGECSDGAGVPAALAAVDVDVVVMDLRMRDVDGIEATQRLRRRSSAHPPVLALTTFDDDELLAGALRAGAIGYILKDSSAEDLIRAVRAVAAGDVWLDAAVTARVLTTYRRAAVDRRTGPPSGLLTPREHEVLRAIGRGLTNAEIAATLMVSEVTVKSHIGRVFTKLGLRDRAAAIVYAFDYGIVSPGQDPDAGNDGAGSSAESDHAPQLTIREPPPPPVATPSKVPGFLPQLRFSMLGPVRAWRGGAQLNLGARRQQALLAALVLRPDVTVSRRELLDGVWGLEPPGTGGKVLPVYVHRLRKCLRATGEHTSDSVIGQGPGGYRFVADGVWVDVARLAEIVTEAGAAAEVGDLAAAVDACGSALDLFHGEPLAGLPGPFAEGERRRLAERRIALSQGRAELQLRLGRNAETVGELSAVMATNPHREPLAALLMRALYAGGRRAEALAVYAQIRRRLVDDLGVEPGDKLRRTHQAVLREDDGYLSIAQSPGAAGKRAMALLY